MSDDVPYIYYLLVSHIVVNFLMRNAWQITLDHRTKLSKHAVLIKIRLYFLIKTRMKLCCFISSLK